MSPFVYEEKSFKRLIEDVTDLVSDLVELFPATQALQQKLGETEVSEIGTNESLPILKDIVADQDKYLEAAIAKVIENSKDSLYNVTFSGSNNSDFQLGHNSGTISVSPLRKSMIDITYRPICRACRRVCIYRQFASLLPWRSWSRLWSL